MTNGPIAEFAIQDWWLKPKVTSNGHHQNIMGPMGLTKRNVNDNPKQLIKQDWLVVWNMFFLHILGIVIPID